MHYNSIEELLIEANERGASDLHITVGVPPKIRIDGVLTDISDERIMPADAERLIMAAVPDRAMHQLKEQGESDFSYAVSGVGRYRVNAFRQRGSYACVIRIVGTNIPSPAELRLPDAVTSLTGLKRGLVLVTGPAGSGKSTTLASMVDVINSAQNVNIITLEDPIEYLHRHKKAIVNQREIGVDSRSYTAALRAALREDPDVIMVGEMRDLDTISTAITAAETGHLVLSTLHTTGAAKTIDRIIDVFPPQQQQQIRVQLAGVLEAVVSQQLMPRISGGRAAAFEVMLMNPAVKNLIRESKTHQINNIIQTSRKSGMILMDDSLLELYERGEISKETAFEFAQDQQNMSRRLKL